MICCSTSIPLRTTYLYYGMKWHYLNLNAENGFSIYLKKWLVTYLSVIVAIFFIFRWITNVNRCKKLKEHVFNIEKNWTKSDKNLAWNLLMIRPFPKDYLLVYVYHFLQINGILYIYIYIPLGELAQSRTPSIEDEERRKDN